MKKVRILIGTIILAGCAHHQQIAPSTQTQCHSIRNEMSMIGHNRHGQEDWKILQQQKKLKTEYDKLQCHNEIAAPV